MNQFKTSFLHPWQSEENPNKKHHRTDIQGLRAVAVLMVVAFHSGLPLPGGFIGVDIFFVISGFVITEMLLREHALAGRVNLYQFYLRRFKRLAPALALMVSVTLLVSFFVHSPLQVERTIETALGALFMLANLIIALNTGNYFDADATSNPLLNTWSLSVEEQFYLVFPLVVVVSLFASRNRRARSFLPTIVVVSLALVSFSLTILGSLSVVSNAFLGFYSPITRAWEFAVGAILAISLKKFNPINLKFTAASGIAGAILLVASLFLFGSKESVANFWLVFPVSGTALLIYSGLSRSSSIVKLLRYQPLVRVGDMSYSIYLWHWPIIVFSQTLWPDVPYIGLIAAVFSLLPAAAAFVFLEEPLRHLKVTTLMNGIRLIGWTLIPPLVLTFILFIFTSQTLKENFPPDSESEWHITNLDCGDLPTISDQGCWSNATSKEPPVFLLGDSNATMFSDAVVNGTTRPVFVGKKGGCPFLPFDSLPKDCRDYYTDTLEDLRSTERGTVLLAFTDGYFWSSKDFSLYGELGSASDFESGLTQALSDIQRAGHETLVIYPIHRYNGTPYTWERCRILDLAEKKCPLGAPFRFIQALQEPIRSATTRVTDAMNVKTLDFQGYVCDKEFCPIRRNDKFIFADEAHISKSFSKSLSPQFRLVLQR